MKKNLLKPEAMALLAIAQAIRGLDEEKACAALAMAASSLGHYDIGEKLNRLAAVWAANKAGGAG